MRIASMRDITVLLSLILTCHNVASLSLNKSSSGLRDLPSSTSSTADHHLPNNKEVSISKQSKNRGLAFVAAAFVASSIVFSPVAIAPPAFAFEDWSHELSTEKVESAPEIKEESSSIESSVPEDTSITATEEPSSSDYAVQSASASETPDESSPAFEEEAARVSKEERKIEELEFQLGELSDAQIAWLRNH
jgi:hypothetical protein